MMDMNGMMDRCVDAMSSMMGGGMMGNGIILVLLFLVLFNCTGRMEAASGLPMDRIPQGAKFPEASPGKPTVSARA